MTKLEIAKSVTSFVVGAGTAKIITQIIKHNTQPDGVADIVTMTAGATVLGMMVSDISRKYTDAKIDAAVEWWNENVKKS